MAGASSYGGALPPSHGDGPVRKTGDAYDFRDVDWQGYRLGAARDIGISEAKLVSGTGC